MLQVRHFRRKIHTWRIFPRIANALVVGGLLRDHNQTFSRVPFAFATAFFLTSPSATASRPSSLKPHSSSTPQNDDESSLIPMTLPKRDNFAQVGWKCRTAIAPPSRASC
ncbi:hypothetical protein HDK64DRAFT_280055 [Phyllosticta capitalensis]